MSASVPLLSSAALAALGALLLAKGFQRWRSRRRARHALEQRFAEMERRYAVAVLSAAVAHELVPSRLLLRDMAAHAPLEEEDRQLANEEVARLEKLLARLRRTRHPEAPHV